MIATSCHGVGTYSLRGGKKMAKSTPKGKISGGGTFFERKHFELPQRKKSSTSEGVDQSVLWEGVNTLCQVMDAIVESEMETDFFEGKDVLEIGFATGLPSVYAYENGAAEVVLHSSSKTSLQMYCKPTLRRNAIPENKCKFSSGDLSQMKKAIGGKKFDVILAAELLYRHEDEFELAHEILDEALSHDGICFLSSPTHYFTVDSNLASFLDLVKKYRKFDVVERWSSPRTDVVQRKVSYFKGFQSNIQ
ncbi:hypothetical protein COOONC_19668 [Cooperia oncophora]